jgi:hypothetical protein
MKSKKTMPRQGVKMTPVRFDDLVLYDVRDLARKFRLNPLTVRRYLRDGKLRGRKIGTRWFVSAESLAEYFRQPLNAEPKAKINAGAGIEARAGIKKTRTKTGARTETRTDK